MSVNDAKGKLIVKVTTGLGAIPISNAQIYISPYKADNVTNEDTFSLVTDRDGLSKTVELSAPAKGLSLTPDNVDTPYSEYVISIQKEGFTPVEIIGLPVFDGVTSIQNVNLVPLTEDEMLVGSDTKLIYRENGAYKNLMKNSGDDGRVVT